MTSAVGAKIAAVIPTVLKAAVAGFLAGAMFASARAEEACPPSVSAADPIVTEWKGLRLDTPSYANVRGVWMKLPIAYWFWGEGEQRLLYLKPPAERTEPALEKLGFVFWMPTGRWIERLSDAAPTFHVCEQGRPKPSEGDFRVSSQLKWPGIAWEGEEPPFTTVAQRKHNILGGLALPSNDREYGLIRYRRPSSASFQYYGNMPGEPFELDMHCTLPDQVPSPNCEGEVWWPKERYLFRLYLAQRDLPHWRQAVEMQRTLVNGWLEAATSNLKP